MAIKLIAVAAAILLCASMLWKLSRSTMLREDPGMPQAKKEVVFDNGSVRDYRPASEPAAANTQAAAPGSLRKCQRREQVTYTNLACPNGFTEKAVAGPPVNVVAGQTPPKPTVVPNAPNSRSSLRDALDLSRDENLREKMVERAVEGRPR